MVCCALGSSLFGYALRKGVKLIQVPRYIHGTAVVANLFVVMFVEDKTIVFASFCLFEVACGVFFPCYGTLRSMVIPEENRAAVMNFFRIPLNAFVVAVLIKVRYTTVMLLCALFQHCNACTSLTSSACSVVLPARGLMRAFVLSPPNTCV